MNQRPLATACENLCAPGCALSKSVFRFEIGCGAVKRYVFSLTNFLVVNQLDKSVKQKKTIASFSNRAEKMAGNVFRLILLIACLHQILLLNMIMWGIK